MSTVIVKTYLATRVEISNFVSDRPRNQMIQTMIAAPVMQVMQVATMERKEGEKKLQRINSFKPTMKTPQIQQTQTRKLKCRRTTIEASYDTNIINTLLS